MSSTKEMMRQHSAFYKARREAADAAAGKPSSVTAKTNHTSSNPQPPSYYNVEYEKSRLATTQDLPAYSYHHSTAEITEQGKTLRKGKKLGDWFGAAFTGYLPKDRVPAWEVIEPRHKELIGAMPGAVEARRCTGGMSSSGKKKETRQEKKERQASVVR